MVELGYAISSEEHLPGDAVQHAAMAEEAGFPYTLVSDHFHPWVSSQGHSPFVWSLLGGISQSTQRMRIGTGVTCPLIRIHPAIIAQAAATTAAMMPGRFFLGLGTGENLNEHILGHPWPPVSIRQEMLEEAVEVIRQLWTGKLTTYHGQYYAVENARIYTLPEELPPIVVAASGPESGELAGRIGDGLCSTKPDPDVVQSFKQAGGDGKPCYAQVHVCWAESEEEAVETALEIWPNSSLKGPLNTELALPEHFEAAAAMVTKEQIAEDIACGPDPERHMAAINEYAEAGFDHVYVHQISHDQEGFIRFYEKEIMPRFR